MLKRRPKSESGSGTATSGICVSTGCVNRSTRSFASFVHSGNSGNSGSSWSCTTPGIRSTPATLVTALRPDVESAPADVACITLADGDSTVPPGEYSRLRLSGEPKYEGELTASLRFRALFLPALSCSRATIPFISFSCSAVRSGDSGSPLLLLMSL